MKKRKAYSLELEFVTGSEFQAVFGRADIIATMEALKRQLEAQHKGNKVEFEVFLNDYEGVLEALGNGEAYPDEPVTDKE